MDFATYYNELNDVGYFGKEAGRHYSQKRGLIGAKMARSFELELKRIRAGKTIRFGGSCLIAARKTSQFPGK